MDYYNENDRRAAAWLQELIATGLIPPGHVDERSIRDVQPGDLVGYRQCHFFAGIGGWPYALQLAGWPESVPVWTGSCPCQPFSAAGKRKGTADDRHLWPEFHRLIRECRPSVVFGEQVASRDGLGWLDGVFADLEGSGYACGAADLCAAGVGAPHIRQRLYWAAHCSADADRSKWQCPGHAKPDTKTDWRNYFSGGGEACDPPNTGQQPSRQHGPGKSAGENERPEAVDQPGRCNGLGLSRDPDGQRYEGDERRSREGEKPIASRPGFWSDFDILDYRDGKQRRVESGTFPLAHGVPGRVGLLRGYGNAIVPQVAATFVRSYLEAVQVADRPLDH